MWPSYFRAFSPVTLISSDVAPSDVCPVPNSPSIYCTGIEEAEQETILPCMKQNLILCCANMIQSHKVDLEEVQVEVGPSDIRPTSDPISRKFMQQNQDKIVTSYIYYVISEVAIVTSTEPQANSFSE